MVLQCVDLVRRFGERTAVDGVTLRIEAGETYGLLGPNGAGKTTCISMICGLLHPDAGQVIVSGQPMTVGRCAAKARIGLVPQEIALYPDLTARENLQFLGRLYRLDRARLRRRADEVLDIVGLLDRADDRVAEYSGGMQRRVNIAAGLLHEPALLVLDEPTVGVDPHSRTAIMDALDTLRAHGLALLYTTHYMEEAERLCDRVGILDEGRLLMEGTKRELLERIGSRPVVRLGVTTRVEAPAVDACAAIPGVDRVSLGPGIVEVTVNDPSRLLARVLEVIEQHGVGVSRVDVLEPDLESVFLHLTGKALRDA